MSTKKEFKKVLAASKSESILAVVEGLPVDANGFFLTEAQLSAIDDELESNATAISNHATEVAGLNTQITAANTARDNAIAAQHTAEQSVATANQTIATKDAEISQLNAKVKTLEDGTPDATQTRSDADKTGETTIIV
jgi:chromosome segregation ATPase